MRGILIGFLCSALPAHVFAQTVTAIVKDSVTGAPVKFATAGIRSLGNDSVLQESISDDKGRIAFRKLPKGDFEITLSSVGYNPGKVPIAISAGNKTIDLGILFLKPRSEMLKEVIVDSRKSLIEERIDRTVYNVERDKTLIGGDATDALRKVPLLSVDLDGNVTLRGSPNFKVLINSKPSTITADNLADALKQIPADQIRSVEVITAPSAKYDADGSAGIINIILKQNRLRGVILSSDMAIGTRASFLGLDGEYRNKKMGLSIGGFGRATYHVTGNYDNVQSVGSATTEQNAATRKDDLSGNYNLGWDYEPDKNNFMTASLRYSFLNGHNFQDNLRTDNYQGGVLDSTLLNQVQITARSGTVDLSFDYTHEFARPQREFSFLTLVSRTDRTNGFTTLQQDPANDTLIGQLRNNNVSSNQEITLQADYQSPIDSNQLLDFGAKYIIRDVISKYQYLSAAGNGDYEPELSPSLTNVFNYHQNVMAGYFDYTWTPLSAYSFRAGARYEYTSIGAQLQDSSAAMASIPSYGVLAPNINIARRLNNGKLIKLAYSRRIQRPSIQFLNPNLVASNPVSVTTGNPALGPEYTSNVEIGYNTAIRQTTLDFAGFYRHTTKAIESLGLPNGDTIEKTYANIGKESTCGLNVFANLVIGQKLSLSGGADLYYTVLDNAPPSTDTADASSAGHNKGWIFSARLSGGYTFKEGWSIYLYSYYRGRQVLLQGYQTGFPYYSLTLKRDFRKKKGTIGLGAENFFSPGIAVKNYIRSADFYQSSTNLTHTISFRVYVSYRLGKLTVEKAERKKKSITNDDLKQD
jgi:outer membrane receptor protein involved in Fe transport